MRKPDPTRFTGRSKRKPDKLEMKGFSAPLPVEAQVKFPSSDKDLNPPSDKSDKQIKGETKREYSYVPTDERTDVRTDVRTMVEKKVKRIKIRHAFDIFEDQLRELQLLQLEAVRSNKKKPKLGEMVQKAIDQYLDKNRSASKKNPT